MAPSDELSAFRFGVLLFPLFLAFPVPFNLNPATLGLTIQEERQSMKYCSIITLILNEPVTT